MSNKVKCTIMTENMSVELLRHQLPNPSKKGAKDIKRVRLEVDGEFGFYELKEHIEYLVKLHDQIKVPPIKR